MKRTQRKIALFWEKKTFEKTGKGVKKSGIRKKMKMENRCLKNGK
jgi:hypothetical protein